jgi:SHS2 domain-containing protein
MFEFFEHTADMGIRVHAATLESLIAEGGRALFSVLVADLAAVRPDRQATLRIEGVEPEELFFDALDDLLYRFTVEHLLFARFEVALDETGATMTAWGEPFDPARHELDHDVKAITYHRLRVHEDADGWSAEVIVDL